MSEVKVTENPINISFGSTLLEPHMDVVQYESKPGLVLLHCLREYFLGSPATIPDSIPQSS
ncbi:hypothetical protein GBAR_LOCUS15057 [Geodia barretti]|uniref:Uncharacterized protein n=1 Tax=Geodia barretti TaxID=519541 RepID=A0AA35SC74_GEOBA|nr:hypothetical protein GBAR_LOCUS15057 [Geodia barretti]